MKKDEYIDATRKSDKGSKTQRESRQMKRKK